MFWYDYPASRFPLYSRTSIRWTFLTCLAKPMGHLLQSEIAIDHWLVELLKIRDNIFSLRFHHCSRSGQDVTWNSFSKGRINWKRAGYFRCRSDIRIDSQGNGAVNWWVSCVRTNKLCFVPWDLGGFLINYSPERFQVGRPIPSMIECPPKVVRNRHPQHIWGFRLFSPWLPST